MKHALAHSFNTATKITFNPAEILPASYAEEAANLINLTRKKLDKPYHLRARSADDIRADIAKGYPLIGITLPDNGQLVGCVTVSPYHGNPPKGIDKDQCVIIRSLCVDSHFSGHKLSSQLVDKAIQAAQMDKTSILLAKVSQDNDKSLKKFISAGFQVLSSGLDTYTDKNKQTEIGFYKYHMMGLILPPLCRSPTCIRSTEAFVPPFGAGASSPQNG